MHTIESQYEQHKIKCLHNSFARTLQNVNGAEQYIKKRIEGLCRGKKLSVEEVTYLFMKNFDNF